MTELDRGLQGPETPHAAPPDADRQPDADAYRTLAPLIEWISWQSD